MAIKHCCLALSCLLLAACRAGPMPAAESDLDTLIHARAGAAVQVSVLVVDLRTGERVLEHSPGLLLHPASTMKLLTTAAICRRAPDFKVETRLQVDALLAGRLTLVGAGDPFLEQADLVKLVRALKSQGLRRVRGSITIVDPLAGRPRFGQGWMWDDEPAPFMPHLSGLTLSGGCVTVSVTRTPQALQVEVKPPSDWMQVIVERRPGAKGLVIDRNWQVGGRTVSVRGDLPVGGTARRRLSVPSPARHAGRVLAALLVQEGLADRPLPEGHSVRRLLSRKKPAAEASVSRTLTELVRRCNKPSDNLAAELLLRHLPGADRPARDRGLATAAEGIEVIRAGVAALGLDPEGYRFADGSGVSHYDLVSAELLVKTLLRMEHLGGPAYAMFRDSLPVAGRDGTLKGRMGGTVAEGRVQAKTGSLAGVSTLAGYLQTVGGRQLAFAILVQNFVGSARPWRDLQDAFCVQLVNDT